MWGGGKFTLIFRLLFEHLYGNMDGRGFGLTGVDSVEGGDDGCGFCPCLPSAVLDLRPLLLVGLGVRGCGCGLALGSGSGSGSPLWLAALSLAAPPLGCRCCGRC